MFPCNAIKATLPSKKSYSIKKSAYASCKSVIILSVYICFKFQYFLIVGAFLSFFVVTYSRLCTQSSRC